MRTQVQNPLDKRVIVAVSRQEALLLHKYVKQ